MSAHNHDEEIMKQFGRTKTAKRLDQKISAKKNEIAVNVALRFDIGDMDRDDAVNKIVDAIEKEVKKLGNG